jgi:hypothetical protein
MATTFTKIESYTVPLAGVTSVTLGSGGTIPQTYKDLVLKISARSGGSSIFNYPFNIRFNGASTDTNLSSRGFEGDGTNAVSYTNAFAYLNASNGGTSTSPTFSSHDVYLGNYTSTTNKLIMVDGILENNANTYYGSLQQGWFATSSPITSITIVSGNTLVQYSEFTLYGVLNT